MSRLKLKATHLDRRAVVYLRQSTMQQVHDHQESTARQYEMRRRALDLGWAADRVDVIDEDLGLSGASVENRQGTTTTDPWTPDPMLQAPQGGEQTFHRQWALHEGCMMMSPIKTKGNAEAAPAAGAVAKAVADFLKVVGFSGAVVTLVEGSDVLAEKYGVNVAGSTDDPTVGADGFIPDKDLQNARVMAVSASTMTESSPDSKYGGKSTVSVVVCGGSACPDGGPTEAQIKAASAQAQALADLGAAKMDIKQYKYQLSKATRGDYVLALKEALAAAEARKEAAIAAKQKADEAREKADKDAAEAEDCDCDEEDEPEEPAASSGFDPETFTIADCQLAAARALIECLAPEGTGEPAGAMVCSGAKDLGTGQDIAPEILTTDDVDGGACTCDESLDTGTSHIMGQMALYAQGGGVVDPSPVEE